MFFYSKLGYYWVFLSLIGSVQSSKPDIAPEKLEELLLMCTTEVPFRNIDGKLYMQTDGVSMGCPLGPTFSNFYMADLENQVLDLPGLKPNIYCRFVDNIFTDADQELLLRIKKSMEENSVVKFTYELSKDNKLPFLDILTYYTTNQFETTVYIKPTDAGICLNGRSECPDRYKETVILSYAKRAWTTCSTYEFFESEMQRVKQVLVNNSYTNTLIDKTIKNFLNSVHCQSMKEKPSSIPVYYKNQMNDAYKVDEKVIKKIIKDNIRCTNEKTEIKMVIYYNNLKTKSLIMQNNLTAKKRELSQTNIIYQFDCPENECIHENNVNNVYLGFTHCTMSRRLSYHLQNGALKDHFLDKHHRKLERKESEPCIKIRYKENDSNRLEILESLMILTEKPELNKQDTGKTRILSLFQ